MFLHHDNINCLGVFEGKEAKPSGSACAIVSHDSTLEHLAKLGEVIA